MSEERQPDTKALYVEGQRLHDNPEWYIPEREVINLPKEAQRKHKQKLKVRYIPVRTS